MNLENMSLEERAAAINGIIHMLGVTTEEAREALTEFRRNGGTGTAELHIPINKDSDFYLYGMRVVIDRETDSIFVKEVQ